MNEKEGELKCELMNGFKKYTQESERIIEPSK